MRVLRRVQRAVESELKLRRRGFLPPNGLENFAELATPGFYEAIDRGDIKVHRGCTVKALRVTYGRPG